VTDETRLQVRPKDDDSSLSLSKVRFGLIARGRRDAAILLGPSSPEPTDPLSGTRGLAEEGDAEAQFDLGEKYEFGNWVPQDHAQAAYWYRKAADQGHDEAQFKLGYMYDKGQGVPQDYAEAAR
jgi:TPR repeat protein